MGYFCPDNEGQFISSRKINDVGYVSDLVYATASASNATAIPAEIYNVTGEEITNSKEIALAVAEILGMEPKFEEASEEREGEMYLADVTKMKRDLWEPRIGLKEYVRRAVRAVREDIWTPQDWMQ